MRNNCGQVYRADAKCPGGVFFAFSLPVYGALSMFDFNDGATQLGSGDTKVGDAAVCATQCLDSSKTCAFFLFQEQSRKCRLMSARPVGYTLNKTKMARHLHTPKAVTYHEQYHTLKIMIGHSLGRI